MAITPLRHPLNRRWWPVSMAIETGCLHGAVGQRRSTVADFASISTTSLVSVRLAYTLPSPADAPYSGLPPSGMFVIEARAHELADVEDCDGSGPGATRQCADSISQVVKYRFGQNHLTDLVE